MKRTIIEFEIEFVVGTILWIDWSANIFSTIPYEDFCRKHPQLFPFLCYGKDAKRMIANLKRSEIVEVHPGDTVYANLRSYGETWYKDQFQTLPDNYRLTYFLVYHYLSWANAKHTKLHAVRSLFKEKFIVDHVFVKTFGSNRILIPPTDILITKELCIAHPSIISDHNR